MDHREKLYERYASISGIELDDEHQSHYVQRKFVYKKVLETFFPSNRSSNILDLGCGSGYFVQFAIGHGYDSVKGVDHSEEQVRLAHKRGVFEIECIDSLSYLRKTDSSTIDIVTSFDVIEHLTVAELLEIGVEIHRVLKPGGSWLIHTVNGSAPFFGDIRFGDLTHEQAFTNQSLSQLSSFIGFGQVRLMESGPVVHGVFSFFRWILWKFINGLFRFMHAVETGEISSTKVWTRNFYAVMDKLPHL